MLFPRGTKEGVRGEKQTKTRAVGGGEGRERWRQAESGERSPGRQSALGRQEETGRRALIRGSRTGGGQDNPGGSRYLNVRLCHTRGASDNFITSAFKNDCWRMQMASPSQPPASALPPAAGGGPGNREPPDLMNGPRPLLPHPCTAGTQSLAGPEGTWVREQKCG